MGPAITKKIILEAELRLKGIDKATKKIKKVVQKDLNEINTLQSKGSVIPKDLTKQAKAGQKALRNFSAEAKLVQEPITKNAEKIKANAQVQKRIFADQTKLAKTKNEIQTSLYKDQLGQEKQEATSRNQIFDKFKKKEDDHTKALYEDEKRTKAATSGKRGFRMELLSTMFAGMALTKALDGQIKKTRDLIGATALHEAAMLSAYLPAQMQLADMTRGIDLWLLNLNDSEKAAVGWGATVLNWGGQALMTFSQIGLALDGIEKLGGIKGVLSFPMSLAKQIGGLFGAGGTIGKMGGVVGAMGNTGSAGLPSGKLMSKVYGKFSKSFVKVFTGMGKSLTALGEFGAFSIASTLWDKIQQFGAALGGAIGWAVAKVASLFTEFGIGDKLKSILSGMSKFFKKIGDKVGASKVATWFTTAFKTVLTATKGFFSWIKKKIVNSKVLSWFTTAFKAVLNAASGFFSWIKKKIVASKVATWFTTAFAVVLKGAAKFFDWIKEKLIASKSASWFTSLLSPVKLAMGGLFTALSTGLVALGVAAEAYLDFESLMNGPNKEGFFEGGGIGIGIGNIGNRVGGGTFYDPVTGEITQAGLLAQKFLSPTNIRIGDYEDYSSIAGNSSNLIAGILANTSRNAAQQFIAEYFRNQGLSGIYGRQVLDAGGFEGWVDNFRNGYSGPFAFANGGIVNSPTMGLLGESGPEAVIPLDQFGEMGGNTFNINIDASVSNNMDLRHLAEEISNIIEINQRSTLSL